MVALTETEKDFMAKFNANISFATYIVAKKTRTGESCIKTIIPLYLGFAP